MSDAAPLRAESNTENADVIAEQFAIEAARIAAEQRSENVVILDLRGLSNLTDFFVIGTGTSARQMRAVEDFIRQHGKSIGRRPLNVASPSNASWILVDFVDVVIHLFDEEHRDYYDLDGLWGDAPIVEWQSNDSRETVPRN